MQSYTEADAVLTGRCKERRKVANNTWLERRSHNGDPDDEIAVRLHDTDVVTYRRDGAISLNTGGWFTVTTKARINEFTPFSISSVKGEWFVAQRNPNYNTDWDWEDGPNPEPYWYLPVPFRDHMTWHGGDWSGIPPADILDAERAARNAIRKAIREFVKGITADDIARQFANTAGDCFLCRFDSDDCLAAHVEERYFHATLAHRAVKAAGFLNPDLIMSVIYDRAERGQVDRLLTDSLRKYLNRHLLEGVATR